LSYTVKKLSELSGISIRTLRWYDEVGLLKPSYYGSNGYRYYEKEQILKLQQILFYRELDLHLDDIKRFVRKQSIEWRSHNHNICDTPNLYFALLPNGEFAPCCDYRLGNSYPAFENNFPEIYRSKAWRNEVVSVTRECNGCMYGSYPEMTISMRYMAAKLQRIGTFFTSPPEKKWPLTYEQLIETADKILNEPRDRPLSRQVIT